MTASLGQEPGGTDPQGVTSVRATDGTTLHVEVDECPGAAVTVLMSHGFTANLGEFAIQRDVLRGKARVVLYDQRGHGKSGDGGWRTATIEQLGRDLQTVLEQTCPTGPVVLLGHSMGGMALLAWAGQHPQEVGRRVVGAFLLATSAGELVTSGGAGLAVRLLTRLRLLALSMTLLRLAGPGLERFRKRGTRAGRAWTRRMLFGTTDAGDPALVIAVQEMLEATPFSVSTAFYPIFLSLDERSSLDVLSTVPTTVLCGTSDRLTPHQHSEAMAERLGSACELVLVPGAGHSVNVTRSEVVDDALQQLLERAVPQVRATA